MSTVVDTLITRYVLDEKDYVRGTKAIGQATATTGSQIKETWGKLANFGKGLLAGIGTVTAIGGAIGYAGLQAVKSAASFDTLERTFAGVLGSMEKGKQMMAALETYAVKSAFSLDALARAAAQLAAGGLDVKTYLPVLERFALVISGVDPNGLEQVAGALLRAKGGGFGEAMESLRKAGVSNADFAAAGAGSFTKGGEFTGTPQSFLKAVLNISNGRMKRIADSVAEGNETKLSNAMDSLERAVRVVGNALSGSFLSSIVAGTDELNRLVDKGVIKEIAEGFTGLFSSVNGEKGAKRAVDMLAVSLMAIPEVIKGIGAFITRAVLGIGSFLEALRIIPKGSVAKAQKDANQFWKEGGTLDTILDSIIAAKEAVAMPVKKEDFPSTGDDGKSPPPADPPLLAAAQKTADNTQKLVDMQESVLGGANLAANGISMINISNWRHASRHRANHLAETIGMAIEQAAAEMLKREYRNRR